ncbi:hypothetical protein NC652_028676 [Populus alba x Populus x berolinensis]|nr:hypothetical protein NC652_028676 [Populus alba x Populus x berolinensis]
MGKKRKHSETQVIINLMPMESEFLHMHLVVEGWKGLEPLLTLSQLNFDKDAHWETPEGDDHSGWSQDFGLNPIKIVGGSF